MKLINLTQGKKAIVDDKATYKYFGELAFQNKVEV